jgi:hypothetical protein
MLNQYYSYAFLVGMYTGGYTNLFSKFIITGLVLYMAHPDHFHLNNFTPLYENLHAFTYPHLSKIYNILPLEKDKKKEESEENLNKSNLLSPLPKIPLTLKINK